MDLKVNIDAASINAELQSAIAKSAIGEELNKIIKEKVNSWSRSYESGIVNTVDREIQKAIIEVIQTRYLDQIKAIVAEKVTEKFTVDLLEKMWEAWVCRSC
jgi:fructose-1,6-bisphosphatase/inositol monophosphatase family enzyme